MDNMLLFSKLETLPEHMKAEVADFIDFLANKAKKENKTNITSQPTFGSAKDMFKMHDDFDEPL